MLTGHYWLPSIHGIYQLNSGALASSLLLDHSNNSVDYRAVKLQHDKYKHALWNPEAAYKTESNLTKFLNRHSRDTSINTNNA